MARTETAHDEALAAGQSLPTHARIAIIGTGFAGLGVAIKLLQAGHDDLVILERADDVAGTWRDNTYPGCMCDVPSHLYSFSFAPNPEWSHVFSPQPEIRAYLRRCAEDFDVIRHVRFGHDVTGATWDDVAQHWDITTSKGDLTADLLVMGTGPLAEANTPDIPGIDEFPGAIFHSAKWDHDHDLSGERVAVIGTGASAIQFIPFVQGRAAKVEVFQRTPPWVLPHPNRRTNRVAKAIYRRLPPAQLAMRAAIYWSRELLILGFVHRPSLMKVPAQMGRRNITNAIKDAALVKKLTPTYNVGCKRILMSNTYYPALAQPNVAVHTGGVHEVRGSMVISGDGTHAEVDTIIFGTGFRVTDNPQMEKVKGTDGRTIGDAIRSGEGCHLGTTFHGFPNLFMMAGPNTGIGHTSLVYMIESQITYLLDALRVLDRRGAQSFDVRAEAQAEFVEWVNNKTKGTIWESGCKSWYLDEHGRNTTLWPGFTFEYRAKVRRFDEHHHNFVAHAAVVRERLD